MKKVTCLMTCLTYMFSISVFEFSDLIEICLQPCEVVKSAQLGLSNTYKKCTSHVLELCCMYCLRGRSQTTFTKFGYHLPPSVYIFYGIKVYKKSIFLTTYPLPLVNVVCERPLTMIWQNVFSVNLRSRNKGTP